MALIKYGGGIVQMSGSIAGNTFARNHYGNYARARTKPINPNTTLQQNVRNSLAFVTVLWSQTLTADQRAAWNLYGQNVPMLNKLGETVYLTGFNHFIRSGAFRKRYGAGSYLDGPTIFEVPPTDPAFSITASEATQQISCTFDNTLGWANEVGGHLVMFVGQPQNAQRNFFDGPWQLSAWLPGDDVAPPASPVVIPSKYAIAAGQHVWVYARISRADARLSTPFRDDVLVGA